MFGVDPFDSYGSAEIGALAWQCRERDHFHLNHTLVYVEILDEAGEPVGPGGTGDVVVTGLVHPATPIIRYRQGDRATLADRPCQCGSRLPALARLDGRIHDWFVVPAGRVAPQRLYLGRHLDQIRAVRAYQVAQDPSGAVELRYVANGPELPAEVVTGITQSYREALPGVPFAVRQVDRIVPDASGKVRVLRSEARLPLPGSVRGGP
jgi:phenylacetate-CoA ligase